MPVSDRLDIINVLEELGSGRTYRRVSSAGFPAGKVMWPNAAIGGIADMSRSPAARRNDANDPTRTLGR